MCCLVVGTEFQPDHGLGPGIFTEPAQNIREYCKKHHMHKRAAYALLITKWERVKMSRKCLAAKLVVVGWVSSPGAETPLLPWGWSPARKGNSRLGPWAGGLALLTNYGLRSHDFSRPLFLHLLNGFSRCVFTAISGKTVNLGEGLRAGMVPQFL